MPWDVPLISSFLLVLLHGPKTYGVSQESVYVIECIRDMIPAQIYNECCWRENNCTITRQQNRGIDCMSRMIMSNYSWVFMNSHDDSNSHTTESPYQYSYSGRWYGDVLETLSEVCRRQPKGKIQNCIRGELIKRCRYSMLEDRITSAPNRWNQNQRRREYYPYNTNYNNNDRYAGGGEMMDRRRYPQQFYGNRHNYGNNHNYNSRSEYGDSQGYFNPRSSNNEDSDDEYVGYPDGDSSRYKYSKFCPEVKIE